MWFGTDSGLVKYDGRRIQKIAVEGPAAARVLALKLDPNGVLWMGTSEGAARLVNGEVRPIPESQSSTVSAIITPQSGRAVMTTLEGEILECSTTAAGSVSVHHIRPHDHPLLTIESRSREPLQLTSLALDRQNLIVGTRSRGLLEIELIGDGLPSTSVAIKEVLSRPRAFFVDAIETDSSGRLWFGAETSADDSGIYDGRDLMRPEKIGAGTGSVAAMKADSAGNIWVGTDARGAFIYRDGHRVEQFTFENTGGGLLSNHIYSVFIDREGVAWFGTDRGVCRYDPHSIRIEAVSTDPESNFVRVLFQSSEGTVWCGSNKGLFVRDKESWQEVRTMKGRIVHSVGDDPQGRLLVGTASGLYCAPGVSSSASPLGELEFSRLENATGAADNIRAIATLRGAVYIANFGRGVERLDGSVRTLIWPDDSAGTRERQVVSLHSENNRLWIGTAEAGVFVYDGKKVAVDHALDELIGSSVWSVEGSSDDVLWLASARGLYAMVSGKLQRVIEGDARSVVSAGKGASGTAVWCATVGGGVFKARLEDNDEPGRGRSVIISRIDAEQGLSSQSVFAVRLVSDPSNSGALVIGTSRGVARYDPGNVAPTINITRVMGKRVYGADDLAGGLRLEYPQNSLALDVAALSSRTFPEQFQYAFSVFDGKGRLISQKLSHDAQLLLENLGSGRYRIEARAFTNDLVPSDTLGFEFAVARAPFPWASTGLSVLLGLALVAMWWGYRQNKRLVRTNVQLGETRMQLARETETERRRIARDLHDQTLADLRGLMMLTDQLPGNGAGNGRVDPSVFRIEIEAISTEIRRICEDLSPSALANVGLAAALEWSVGDAVAHQPAERKFECEFDCDPGIEERIRLEPATQIQIYRIVQEAVSNVCRHSGATRVRLSLKVDGDGDLVIELEDNGQGFDANKAGKTGRGLTNIRSRASLIEAKADWSKRQQGGTLFTLRKSLGVEARRSGDGR